MDIAGLFHKSMLDSSMMTTAKVIKNRTGQAVRLPKELQFGPETREVLIRRVGETLIIEPLQAQEWPEDFWQAFGGMPDDFERSSQVGQRREALDL